MRLSRLFFLPLAAAGLLPLFSFCRCARARDAYSYSSRTLMRTWLVTPLITYAFMQTGSPDCFFLSYKNNVARTRQISKKKKTKECVVCDWKGIRKHILHHNVLLQHHQGAIVLLSTHISSHKIRAEAHKLKNYPLSYLHLHLPLVVHKLSLSLLPRISRASIYTCCCSVYVYTYIYIQESDRLAVSLQPSSFHIINSRRRRSLALAAVTREGTVKFAHAPPPLEIPISKSAPLPPRLRYNARRKNPCVVYGFTTVLLTYFIGAREFSRARTTALCVANLCTATTTRGLRRQAQMKPIYVGCGYCWWYCYIQSKREHAFYSTVYGIFLLSIKRLRCSSWASI